MEAEGYVAMVCFKHGPPAAARRRARVDRAPRGRPARPLDAAPTAQRPWACTRPPPWSEAARNCRSPGRSGHRGAGWPGGDLRPGAGPSIAALIDDTAADAAELDRSPSRRGPGPGRPRPRPLPRPRRILDRPALRGDGARLPAPRPARPADDVQHRRPAGLPRRRRGGPRPPRAGARCTSSARPWSPSSPTPAAAPAATPAGPRPDPGDPRHLPTVHPAAAARRRPGRRLGADGDGGSGAVRAARGDSWDAPRRADLRATGSTALLGDRPTYDDLDYHLSTLFPPVRPRGYLEVRYLDAQPGDGWIAPAVLLTALMSTPRDRRRGARRLPSPPPTAGSRRPGRAGRPAVAATPRATSSTWAARRPRPRPGAADLTDDVVDPTAAHRRRHPSEEASSHDPPRLSDLTAPRGCAPTSPSS